MDKSPIEMFLASNAISLVLFGFVRGAQWGTANGVATTKLIDAFLTEMGLDMDSETARRSYDRMAEKFREVEKMK